MRSRKSKPPTAGNLVLGRKKGEVINVHTDQGLITITVKLIKNDAVWFTFNAPASVNIVRSEIDANDRRDAD